MTSYNAQIRRAEDRMNAAYGKLPVDFFSNKDAASYKFNNIETLLDRLPAAAVSSNEVAVAELDGRAVTAYVGVPWCERICSFCNFAYSASSDAEKHQSYLDTLKREVDQFFRRKDTPIRSIYFGGGTPTYLQPRMLSIHLKQLREVLNWTRDTSVTCEFSTSTVTEEKLKILADSGVNRVSTGLQSLDDATRERANLAGRGTEALTAVMMTAKHFGNFNVDLIYGHPYQSDEDWIETVTALAASGIPSITLYRLELKTRTTFKKLYLQDSRQLTDEMRARLHYFIAREILEEHGYAESPLGWWVKKETLQKNKTWLDYLGVWKHSTPYIGFGQGAFSVGQKFFWRNEDSGQAWAAKVENDNLPASTVKEMPQIVVILNQFMRHARTTKTFDLAVVKDDFAAFGAMPALEATVADCLNWGLVSSGDAGGMHLTEAGESLIHWIFQDLVDRVSDAIVASPRQAAGAGAAE